MGFSEVFGGALIFPSQLSYLSITTAVDVTLQWPTEQQIAGVNVVADWMDIDATVASLNIDMPAATNTATGNKVTFNNIGANSFTVRDSTGGTIQSVAPGEQWVLVLTDNTTAAGTWITSQLGATVSVASAGALAGAGIKAITTTLNQQIDSDVEAATPFTVVDGDRAKCLIYTSGAGTANLTAAATLGNDWFFMLRNSGSGTLNVLPPAGTIDGVASINLDPNDSAFIFTDGTDFFTVGLSSGSTIAFDFVSIAIPGSGDFVLSGANLNRISYRFTGALTGNRKIVVPNTTQQYWVDNQTTGAFLLTVGTAAGASPQVDQGNSIILYSDATDVINAVSSSAVAFPVLIGQGGTGATTIGGAQTNLQVPPVGRLLNTTAPISGGGDLSADRTFVVAAATEGATGVAEIATQVETDAGADDTRIVTPLKLATFSPTGIGSIQTQRCQADRFRVADTTLSDEADLTFTVVNGAFYIVEGNLFLSSADAGAGYKVFLGNNATNTNGDFLKLSDAGFGVVEAVDNISGGQTTETMLANEQNWCQISGHLEMTSTTWAVRWAQLVATGSTTLREGSWIRLTRVT